MKSITQISFPFFTSNFKYNSGQLSIKQQPNKKTPLPYHQYMFPLIRKTNKHVKLNYSPGSWTLCMPIELDQKAVRLKSNILTFWTCAKQNTEYFKWYMFWTMFYFLRNWHNYIEKLLNRDLTHLPFKRKPSSPCFFFANSCSSI